MTRQRGRNSPLSPSATKKSSRFRRARKAGPAALVAVAAITLSASTAVAAPGDDSEPSAPGALAVLPPLPTVPVSEFYTPPSPLPEGRPGDVLRSEDLPPVPGASVQRIMYLSTNQQGESVPVTGVVLTPPVPPQTPGPDGSRPVVVHTPGTRGLADSCAPSNFYDPTTVEPRNIEPAQALGYAQQLAAGVTVVVTDYLGSGTPLPQEYLVADSEAHNGIDALRAALRLDPDDSLNSESPAGFMGVSQGGQAAARIAELLPDYGPDVVAQVKGVVAGGPPTDMQEQVSFMNGNPIVSGYAFAALLGLDAAYPDLGLDRYVTPEGQKVFDRVRSSCIAEESAGFGTLSSDDVTDPDVSTLPGWQAALGDSKIGNTAPEMPTYLFNGTLDTVVPPHMTPRLHDSWCAKGADSEFVSYPGTEHVTSLVAVGIPPANQWILDRLGGKAVEPGCSRSETPSLG